MTKRESLEWRAADARIEIVTVSMPDGVKAAYARDAQGPVVGVSDALEAAEARCACAEAMAHHFGGGGDDGGTRRPGWAYETLAPLEEIAAAYVAADANRFAVAECLGVTADFLDRALRYWGEVHGDEVRVGVWLVRFMPCFAVAPG